MLSSGLDSSALAYVLAKELSVPLHTFTLGFDDTSFDESRDAGAFATELGLPWHRDFVSGSDVARDFPAMIAHMSSLQSNTAQILYFYVSRMIRAAGYKVALNGNGGDELFAGYPTYRATRLFGYYRRAPAVVRNGIHQLAKRLPTSFGRVSLDYQIKKFTEFSGTSSASAHGYWRTMFSPTELRAVMREDAFPELGSHSALYEGVASSFADLERMTTTDLLKADMLAWLQPMLPWTDNMSMAHGVELRLPMLDHRLVEFAYSLPESFLFRGWNLKRIMKAMLANRLPRDVVFRRKRGTHLPISRWLNAELAPVADTYLSSSSIRSCGMFDEAEVERLLSRHRSGAQDNTFKLWNLIIFNAWMGHHGMSVG
jgi:asparagine synthase (glutamine-hydrolysing)